MLKNISTLILFLFLMSCGYEAIYSKKNKMNYEFSISELNFTGDRDINLRIKKRLNKYILMEKDKNFALEISSAFKKIVLAKDISGDPTSFKIVITLDIEVLMKNDVRTNLQLVESFNYNNNTNKFDLTKYEKEIKVNLAETAMNKLIFKISNIR